MVKEGGYGGKRKVEVLGEGERGGERNRREERGGGKRKWMGKGEI